MMRVLSTIIAAVAALLVSASAAAQTEPTGGAIAIAIPPLSTPKNEQTPAGSTYAIGSQMADVIAKDLAWSQRFAALNLKSVRVPSFPEVTAPSYPMWRNTGAGHLVTGFVQARPDGRLTVGCYLYDVRNERELTRKGFIIAPTDWRKAAHRCSDAIYMQATGEPGLFESRIAYVEEVSAGPGKVKRLAVQDLDLADHRYLTSGDATVISPAWSPRGDRLAYVSFADGRPHVRLVSANGQDDRPLLPDASITFAPRFSPDGRQLLFSMAEGGNTDLHLMDLGSGAVRRLTSTPGSDTSASFSPDGSRIVFESDRSGMPQVYVMNANGSSQRRVSFGGGGHSSPSWSPDGQKIAFAKIDNSIRRIGVMDADGANVRLLTRGPSDEAPAWGPSSSHIMFHRQTGGGSGLFTVALSGGEPTPVVTPRSAADVAWARPRE
jgi:TolB protein